MKKLMGRIIEFLGRSPQDTTGKSETAEPPLDGYDQNRVEIPVIEELADDELRILNDILPCASFVVDSRGRRFGKQYSSTKRSNAAQMPDPRIVEFDRRFPLGGRTVLELGCFEGNHTVALCERAEHVIAVDSRIENVVKTIVRCAMFGHRPMVHRIDLEQPLPADFELGCDLLHRIGVLYHLTDPVGHLRMICSKVRHAVTLDTHVAPENATLHEDYTVQGRTYRYMNFAEGPRSSPFAGMLDHAKWLLEADLIEVLHDCGFDEVDVAERRDERNGPRVLIYAARSSNTAMT